MCIRTVWRSPTTQSAEPIPEFVIQQDGGTREFTSLIVSQVMLLTSHTLRTTGLETLGFKGCFAWADNQKYQNRNQDSPTTWMCWHLDLEAPEFSGAKANIILSSGFVTLLSVTQFLCLLPLSPTWLSKNIKNKASFDYLILSQLRHFWVSFFWQNSQLYLHYWKRIITDNNGYLLKSQYVSSPLYTFISLLLRTLRDSRCVYSFSTTPLRNPPEHTHNWLHHAFSHLI